METSADIIELILPLKAEYVSIARLTVSGIANRMGFDIEIIEDIKVAVSEVCSKYVQKGSSLAEKFKIIFTVSKDCLKIGFDSEDKSLRCIFNEERKEGIL
jgi:serine/threonine-protein kinase RsbW